MRIISAVLLHAVVLCLLVPGTALNARHLRYVPGGQEGKRGQHPATILPRRARHHPPMRRVPRCQNTVGMMPPDDEKEPRRSRRAKFLTCTIALVDQITASRVVPRLSSSRAPAPPPYQSLCVLLI
jgi:hypothetical protein